MLNARDHTDGATERRPSQLRVVWAGVVLALALAGCNPSDALEVQDPDVVRPDAIDGPEGLPLYLAAVRTDFQNALNGSTSEGQTNLSGLFTDEFTQTESFPTRFEVETRSIRRDNTTMATLFLDLARARASGERAARKYVEFDQPDAPGRSVALSLAGYAYILFAENYCSGVPFTTLNDDLTLTYGEPQTTQEMLEIAIAKFDTALTIATGSSGSEELASLALVGRARVLVDLGRFADAAAAAADVPTTFRFLIEHSQNSARQDNGVWQFSTSQGRWGVADREAGEGLPFVSSGDIRVPNRPRAANGGRGFDGFPLREQLKYDERTDAIVLADGVEARLIEAEAALRAGDASRFLAKLNEVRADATVRQNRELARYAPSGVSLDALLPPLTDPGSQTAREDLLFRERGLWMFATSHRLGDLRRLVRQYGRPVDTVFPSGAYASSGNRRTGTYGTDVSFPIPIAEDNNPSLPKGDAALKGCISLAP